MTLRIDLSAIDLRVRGKLGRTYGPGAPEPAPPPEPEPPPDPGPEDPTLVQSSNWETVGDLTDGGLWTLANNAALVLAADGNGLLVTHVNNGSGGNRSGWCQMEPDEWPFPDTWRLVFEFVAAFSESEGFLYGASHFAEFRRIQDEFMDSNLKWSNNVGTTFGAHASLSPDGNFDIGAADLVKGVAYEYVIEGTAVDGAPDSITSITVDGTRTPTNRTPPNGPPNYPLPITEATGFRFGINGGTYTAGSQHRFRNVALYNIGG